MKIELLSVPECPHVDATRDLLDSCLDELGLDVAVTERVGTFPSPTILINGVDVMKNPGIAGAMCRLDVPNRDRLIEALRGAEVS
jgi:hypothetical protein